MRTVTLEELPALDGHDLGTSEWLLIEQSRINTFADATGDQQWIHVDPVAAARGPFRTTIAHGYLTLSLIPLLMGSLVEVECGQALNYGIDKVRFPAPVPAGTRVRLRLKVAAVQEIAGGHQVGFECTIEREGSEKPVCVALVVYRYLR